MKKRRASALLTTMALVALLTVLSVSLVGVFTSTLNFTQRAADFDLARLEAEAAVNKAIAYLADPDAPALGTGEDDVKVIHGSAGRGEATERLYHKISFVSDSEVPTSTNALAASTSGSLGRSVPEGTVHVLSLGVCRDTRVLIEAVLERPPYPYGVASSHKLWSNGLVVRGIEDASALDPGDIEGSTNRPGHLLSNSDIVLEAPGVGTSYVSGSVKAAGEVTLGDPAPEVVGGIFPHSPVTPLPKVPFEDFKSDLFVGGELREGVIRILDPNLEEFDGNFHLTYFSDQNLTFGQSLELDNGFLYCEGDVTVLGGLRGVGAIISEGRVRVMGGASLTGDNKIAILARDDIVVHNNIGLGGAYFEGILYSETHIDAENLFVVGNIVVNSDDPSSPGVRLDNVTVVSSDAAEMEFSSGLHESAELLEEGGQLPFYFDVSNSGSFPGPSGADPNNYPGVQDGDVGLIMSNVESQMDYFWTQGADPDFNIDFNAPPGADTGVLAAFQDVFEMAEAKNELLQQIADEQSKSDDPATPQDEGPDQDRISQWEQEVADIEQAYQSARENAIGLFRDYVDTHTSADGSRADDSITETIPFDFDLNTFLPESETVRVTAWRVTPY